MFVRSGFGVFAALGCSVVLGAPGTLQAQEVDGRLIHQLAVTQPGTRSQGWFGTIYDSAGAAIVAEPGAIVETPVGSFENLPSPTMWSQCGFIRVGMLPVTPMSGFAALTEDQAWVYRLYVHAEGSRSEGLTGVLEQGGMQVFPGGMRRVETPLGVFIAVDNGGVLWGESGWFPESWN